jgi:hypothetical protein
MDDWPAYAPFWCEENIWHLAADPRVGEGAREVVLLTGAGGLVACWEQRAARQADAPVVWDYHVVLAVRTADGWQVWDLDSLAGCPVSAERWLAATFPLPAQVRPDFQPRFLVMPAGDWRRDFHSTRAHMRDAHGHWRHPEPAWPPILGGGPGLMAWVAAARHERTLAELRERWELDRGTGVESS